jgi:glycine oxidase
MTSADVVIAGAGVVGLAVARELARRGASVTVLERGAPGSGSTRAAAGILSPTDPQEWDGELGHFNRQAIADWPGWAADLRQETGEDPGYEQRGELRVGAPGDPFLEATRAGASAAGWACEPVDADGLAELEPGVDAESLIGLHLPGTAAVDADRLVLALLRACTQAGVALVEDAEVLAIDEQASVVETADGRRVAFDRLVVATGAWSASWASHGIRPAVRPVLGESVILRSPEAILCRRAVRTAAGSVVPRADGTYWVGTTLLERGFQDAPSAASVRSILDRAAALIPAADDALVVEARSGLRPVSADGLPVVGEVTPTVVAATGHGREGIIHAPLCARAVADGIADGDWSGVPPSFLPSAER